MKRTSILVMVGILVAFAIWFTFRNGQASAEDRYQMVEITRGDLENIVTTTGTLSAVGTVDVGTQVSGIINHVYVDFNDPVQKGQLLALLDTTLLAVTIQDAEAGVLRARAQYNQAKNDHKRNKQLFENKLISELQFSNSETSLESVYASLQTAKAALRRAEINLNYAFIRSPIDGQVISKNVERGQTVAASLSAPILFVIAEDLSKMEILAEVDESDIGQIKEGQSVRFDVQSRPDEIFKGTARQVRLQPTVIQNVVNYTVVIDAANDNGLLLPGMTATVDFVVEQREDVLLVPNAALRFQPTMEMMQAFRERMQQRSANDDSSGQGFRQRIGGRGGMGNGGFGSRQMPKDVGRVWLLDEDGNLAMGMLRTGASDGKVTEIIRSRNLKEGMQLISAVISSNEEKSPNQRTAAFGRRRPF